jgi:hypothetical protein
MGKLAWVLALLLVPAVALGGRTTTAGDQSLKLETIVKPAKASKKGKPRNVRLRILLDYLSLGDGVQIQEITKTVRFVGPRGLRLHPGRFRRCRLSALQADKDNGCPARSVVGTGLATLDARPAIADPVTAKVTLYNGLHRGTPAVILAVRTPLGVVSVLPFDIHGNRLLLEFAPPQAGDPQIFHLELLYLTLPRNGFVTAPRRCARRSWRFAVTIKNFDGPPITARHRVRCKKAG